MKLGIFGGTFNPVHVAHLIVAEILRVDIGLEKVLFMPLALPPHKDTPVAHARHRLAMSRIATETNRHFDVSDMEVARGGRSYSVDTLRELNRERPGDELHFILGMDAFAEIRTWKEAPSLFSQTNFMLIPRPGHPLEDPLRYLPEGISGMHVRGKETNKVKIISIENGKKIFMVNTPLLGISSSYIRQRISGGLSVRYLVPDEVEAYILAQGLYTTP